HQGLLSAAVGAALARGDGALHGRPPSSHVAGGRSAGGSSGSYRARAGVVGRIPYLGGRIATPDGARRRWSTWRVNRGLTGLCRSQHLAEAALPPGIVGERRPELRLAEVRPQPVGEVELRISAVPEKEIRQPLLAAGADQKIHRAGIRHRMVDIARRRSNSSMLARPLPAARHAASRMLCWEE